MKSPKLDEKKFLHCVRTGEADAYLAAHSERAPVYHQDSDEPHAYDVILDHEASNELFRAYTQGKGNLQDATPEELQNWLNDVAGGCPHEHYENPWKAFAIRSLFIIGTTVIFVAVMAFAVAHR